MKKSDEIRKNAQRINTLAEIYDRILSMRNVSYGKIDDLGDDSDNVEPWEGLETEYNTCTEVLEMIMKLAK